MHKIWNPNKKIYPIIPTAATLSKQPIASELTGPFTYKSKTYLRYYQLRKTKGMEA